MHKYSKYRGSKQSQEVNTYTNVVDAFNENDNTCNILIIKLLYNTGSGQKLQGIFILVC